MNPFDDDSDPDAALPPAPPDERAPENQAPEVRRAFAAGRRFQRRRFVKRWGIALGSSVTIATGFWQAGVIKPASAREPVVSAVAIDKRLERLEGHVEALRSAFDKRSSANDVQLDQWRQDRADAKLARERYDADMREVRRGIDQLKIKFNMQLGLAAPERHSPPPAVAAALKGGAR